MKELPRSHRSLGGLFALRSTKMGTNFEEQSCFGMLEGVGNVRLWWFSLEKKFDRPVIMGGEPVTTEPSVLIVDEDVRSILEEARLLTFFKKFSRHSESITK
eukprot:Gb_03857 [translate_table: standard]